MKARKRRPGRRRRRARINAAVNRGQQVGPGVGGRRRRRFARPGRPTRRSTRRTALRSCAEARPTSRWRASTGHTRHRPLRPPALAPDHRPPPCPSASFPPTALAGGSSALPAYQRKPLAAHLAGAVTTTTPRSMTSAVSLASIRTDRSFPGGLTASRRRRTALSVMVEGVGCAGGRSARCVPSPSSRNGRSLRSGSSGRGGSSMARPAASPRWSPAWSLHLRSVQLGHAQLTRELGDRRAARAQPAHRLGPELRRVRRTRSWHRVVPPGRPPPRCPGLRVGQSLTPSIGQRQLATRGRLSAAAAAPTGFMEGDSDRAR